MARRKLTEEKKNVIASLNEAYDIKTTGDLQEALKDFMSGAMQEMLENYRNGHKSKTLKSTVGKIGIEVPQDRNSEFEPKIIPKYKTNISEIEQKIINMYARGQTTREISEQIEDIYGFETSAEMVSKITDKIVPQIEQWQSRSLSEVYPIVFIDAIVFSVRKDILMLCADGLTGIKEAIEAAFPMTEYQRCIVHMVRNTLQHVSDKYKKQFATDLKAIYHAPDEETGYINMLSVKEQWDKVYPNAMKRWVDNWDVICPIFKYSSDVRKALYTTNAIESLNSQYRRINSSRSVFPSEDALKKALFLATQIITKKWTTKIRNWGQIYGELSIIFDGRL